MLQYEGRIQIWKDYIKRILNAENEIKKLHNVEASGVECLIHGVSRGELVLALKELNTGRAAGFSVSSLKLISGSGEVWIQVMVELCHSPMWIGNAN